MTGRENAVPNRSSSRTVPNRSSSRAVPNQSSNRTVQNTGYYGDSQEAARQELLNKQRELKERLTGKYGRAASGNARPAQTDRSAGQNTYGSTMQRQAQNGDILSRANENVRENEVDLTEREMETKDRAEQTVTDAHNLVNAIAIGRESELMQQVNDLMIMGYQGNLSFERDFVAEGVEMLNSYELSDII